MISLYLFAHQDDEIGVMHTLATAADRAEQAVCIYLTNGAWAGVTPARRNAESLAVLGRLGLPTADVYFLGDSLGVGDGRLVENLDRVMDGLLALLPGITGANGVIGRVVTHAWEGGHHDHDAAHLIGRVLAERLGASGASRQFALYRANASGDGLVFAALLPGHGTIETEPIPLARGARYLLLLHHYRSQARVMLQLGPLIARSYLVDGVQRLQRFPSAALLDRRPAGSLPYERWGLYTYEDFAAQAAPFISRNVVGAIAPIEATERRAS